jgi:hypothetical protein
MVDEKLIKAFVKLVDASIETNKLCREVYNEYCSLKNDPIASAINFCTVNCNAGRGVGKTEYIINNAGPDDLILVSQDRFKSKIKERNNFATVLSVCDLQNHRVPLTRFVNFYIDEPHMIFRNKQMLYEFYCQSASEEREQTWIFLGTQV